MEQMPSESSGERGGRSVYNTRTHSGRKKRGGQRAIGLRGEGTLPQALVALANRKKKRLLDYHFKKRKRGKVTRVPNGFGRKSGGKKEFPPGKEEERNHSGVKEREAT